MNASGSTDRFLMRMGLSSLLVLSALLGSPVAIGSEPPSPAVPTTADRGAPDQGQPDGPPRLRMEIDRETAKGIFRGRSGFFERLPPRPERTPEQRTTDAARLRELYSKPAAEWPAPQVDESVEWEELGLLPAPEKVEPGSQLAARIELGKHLFFDPRLSGSRQLACASCHDPDLAWADGRTVSFGNERKMLRRNSPSLMNVGHAERFFWDGRATSLEEQAHGVLLNSDEMDSSKEVIEARLRQIPAYVEMFSEAYPDKELSIDTASRAIGEFEKTVVGGRSRFDLFLKGNADILSDEAVLGLDLFRREARCINCHHGPTFTDNRLHDVGLSYYGRPFEDLGQFVQTRRIEHVGRFKTPSLRNVSRTGPYMHNGLFPSLTGVLNMYNAGMPTLEPKNEEQLDDPFFPTKSPHLRPLGLNRQDLDDLHAFLRSLEEPPLRVRPPERAPEQSADEPMISHATR